MSPATRRDLLRCSGRVSHTHTCASIHPTRGCAFQCEVWAGSDTVWVAFRFVLFPRGPCSRVQGEQCKNCICALNNAQLVPPARSVLATPLRESARLLPGQCSVWSGEDRLHANHEQPPLPCSAVLAPRGQRGAVVPHPLGRDTTRESRDALPRLPLHADGECLSRRLHALRAPSCDSLGMLLRRAGSRSAPGRPRLTVVCHPFYDFIICAAKFYAGRDECSGSRPARAPPDR